jgi:hypothetical protein
MLTFKILEFDNVLLVALALLLGHNGLGCFDGGEAGGVTVGWTVIAPLQGVSKVN